MPRVLGGVQFWFLSRRSPILHRFSSFSRSCLFSRQRNSDPQPPLNGQKYDEYPAHDSSRVMLPIVLESVSIRRNFLRFVRFLETTSTPSLVATRPRVFRSAWRWLGERCCNLKGIGAKSTPSIGLFTKCYLSMMGNRIPLCYFAWNLIPLFVIRGGRSAV